MIKIITGEKIPFFCYIMDIANFFPGKKRDLSDQSKEQSQDGPKNVREESQGSCSFNDSNVFDEGLDDSDCRNIW